MTVGLTGANGVIDPTATVGLGGTDVGGTVNLTGPAIGSFGGGFS